MAQYRTDQKIIRPQDFTNYEVKMLHDRLTPSGTLTDAFGRLRVSNPNTLFDSTHRYQENDKWSQAVVGNGSSSYNTNQSTIDLTVTGVLNDEVIRETKRVFTYQPGKSLLVMNTFVMAPLQTGLRQRVGYFGAENGIFLEADNTTIYLVKRSYVTGSVVETRVAQANWNNDKFDGTGYSKNIGGTEHASGLDVTKSQIFWIDIEWLGVGDVRCGFVVDGHMVVAHTFHNDNVFSNAYITTAILPIRYEIKNTATTNISHSMKQICSTVISEGGYNQVSKELFARRTSALANVTTTFLPLISMRLKSTRLDSVVIPSKVNGLGIAASGASEFEFALIKNGTLGGTPSWNSNSNNVEVDTAATSISGGTIIDAFFSVSSNQGSSTVNEPQAYNLELQLGRTLAGVSDIYTLCARTISGTNSAIGSIGYYELVG